MKKLINRQAGPVGRWALGLLAAGLLYVASSLHLDERIFYSLQSAWHADVREARSLWLPEYRVRVEALPVDVIFTWTCRNKRRDPDNIASAGQKILLDALQSAGVLPDDGWNQISRISHRFEIGAQDCVEITLTEQCADDD